MKRLVSGCGKGKETIKILFTTFFLSEGNCVFFFCQAFIWGVKPSTLSTIIMEVENGGLEDDFSLQGGHFPLPCSWEEEYEYIVCPRIC